MKLGIIGMGSIGKRHVRSLAEIGERDIVALRTRKGTARDLPPDLAYVHECRDEDAFYASKPEGVIVATPTSLHLDAMQGALRRGIPVFVEKPLVESVERLNEIPPGMRHLVMTGFCLRYHPVIMAVRAMIESGLLGTLYTAYLYCGQYLPLWHPYADYRSEYYSRKELGGGVLRTLSHELDLACFLCGKVSELTAAAGRISGLEIDVEDHAALICRAAGGAVVTIGLDFLNPRSVRRGMLIGEHGSIEYSFDPPAAVFRGHAGGEEQHIGDSSAGAGMRMADAMYRNQMHDFRAVVRHEKRPGADFADGARVMAMIGAAEASVQSRSWVAVQEEWK
ncbi:MAG: Gfo/Idh/MocA family oxidoreductase [Methanomicrobiales archaeon]|nr:Gfo/Idh/MocA family oxidoreductase [Methanomicrobiales archaeon]